MSFYIRYKCYIYFSLFYFHFFLKHLFDEKCSINKRFFFIVLFLTDENKLSVFAKGILLKKQKHIWVIFYLCRETNPLSIFTLDSYPVRNFISIDFFATPSLSPSAAERITYDNKQGMNVTNITLMSLSMFRLQCDVCVIVLLCMPVTS